MIMLVVSAWAGGFEIAQQGAAAGGMGNAGTALGGAEAAWFNPAALTDAGGLRASLGVTLARSRSTMTTADTSVTTTTPVGAPPWLYLSYAHAKWAVAVTANVPFGGGVVWPSDGPQRYEAVQSRPQFLRAAAAFAYAVGPVSLGAGVHVDAGQLRTARATDHLTEDGSVALALRGVGVGGDGYLLVRAGAARVGLSYKSRARMPMSGEVDFDVPAPFAVSRPDQAVTADWALPDRVALGFAWERPRWRLTVEGGVTLWSVNDTLTFDFAEPVTPDTTQVNAWRDTWAVRAGAAGQVHRLVELRGGASVDLPGAPPTDHLGPSSPDGPRLSGTVGIGISPHPAVRVDLAAEPMVVLARTATGDDLPLATYRGWAMIAAVGLTVDLSKQRPPPAPSPAPTEQGPWGEI